MKLSVHMREPAVRTLGPGVRYALWVQGCPRRCPGCVAPEAQALDGGTALETGALAWEILLSGAEGLTISGGEPFLQAEALAELIRTVRRKRDLGVIVYTGYRYEELLADPAARALLEETDLLIDGPYVKELDDGKSLRGSSNQRVIPLTERYRGELSLYGRPERPTEAFVHGAEVHYVGVSGEWKTPETAEERSRT
ncbi:MULTISPECIES: 4Fe-4S single cluster domain-containing protein [unclassified Flavonifractor]|uniref:4Fe-4S single cluster domain-containing protein n=1 Tax=Flavonifractor sp. An92 TaxID=1965666 RepID=UPI00111CD4BC|nr:MULTISPECIES: 4Fe-4S single cluster domain-containing protein [unclassified Flavonifractor]